MIAALAVYLTTAAIALVVVSVADAAAGGEPMTWVGRATAAMLWPLFLVLGLIEIWKGK